MGREKKYYKFSIMKISMICIIIVSIFSLVLVHFYSQIYIDINQYISILLSILSLVIVMHYHNYLLAQNKQEKTEILINEYLQNSNEFEIENIGENNIYNYKIVSVLIQNKCICNNVEKHFFRKNTKTKIQGNHKYNGVDKIVELQATIEVYDGEHAVKCVIYQNMIRNESGVYKTDESVNCRIKKKLMYSIFS